MTIKSFIKNIFEPMKIDGVVEVTWGRHYIFGGNISFDRWEEVKILQTTDTMYKVRFASSKAPDSWIEKELLKLITER